MDLKKIKLTVQRYSYRHFNKRTALQISTRADFKKDFIILIYVHSLDVTFAKDFAMRYPGGV